MVALRWTGNGLSNGTTVTTGNVNTAGNGDTMTYSASGAGGGVMTTASDGVSYYGATGDIRRLDTASFTATRTVVFQAFYTPGQAPTSGTERPLLFRSASANVGAINHLTTGTLCIGTQTLGNGTATPVALTNGDRYQIDGIVMLNPGTPSSSNGRMVIRVRDLTNASWNTTGEWFVDSGYAINMGTADLTMVRYAKTSTGAISSGTPMLIEQIAWDPIGTDLTAATTQSALEAYFIPSPYGGTDYVINIDDDVAITDTSLDQVADFGVTTNDPVGITDSATPVMGAVRGPADPVGITDTVALARGTSAADPVGITDSATRVLDAARAPADPVGVTDSVATIATNVRAPADPVGITDSVAVVAAIDRAPADPVGITDAVAWTMTRVVTVADNVTITDTATPSLDGAADKTVGDPVGIGDLVTTALDLPRTAADPVGISDSLTATLDRVAALAETVGITDVVTAVMTRVVTIADGVGITDLVDPLLTGDSDGTPVDNPTGTITTRTPTGAITTRTPTSTLVGA